MNPNQPFSRGQDVVVVCEYDFDINNQQGQPAWRAPDGAFIFPINQGNYFFTILTHSVFLLLFGLFGRKCNILKTINTS